MANVSLLVSGVSEVPDLRLYTHCFSATEVAELIPCVLLLLFIKVALDYGGIWSRIAKNILRERFGDFGGKIRERRQMGYLREFCLL